MTGPKQVHDVAIVLRALVLVMHQQTDRGAGRPAFECARQDLHRVILAPLGRVPRGAGLAPVEIPLQVGLAEFESWRTTVNDAADCAAVTFAKRSHHE